VHSCSRSSQSLKPSDYSYDSNEESKRESTESKGTGSNKPALNQALVIPNQSASSSFMRRGRTLGTDERSQDDTLDRLKLIDTAMERAMRN
jgi:hypothetical protein